MDHLQIKAVTTLGISNIYDDAGALFHKCKDDNIQCFYVILFMSSAIK